MNINPKRGLTGLVFGWYCILYYDREAPEPEGTVYFDHTPRLGERFMLPSSNYEETWVVDSVDVSEMEFTAKGPVQL